MFRTDDPSGILQPFKGRVSRGISVPHPQQYLSTFTKGDEFVWASFTSTSTWISFSGNVDFDIECSNGIDGSKAKYAPAKVMHLSRFFWETEVVSPPHVKFRVVNVKGNTVQLETVEFPSVWELVEKNDWDGFKKWADANPTRVDTKDSEFSIINTVAESLVAPGSGSDSAINPIQVCLSHHADINEEDNHTGKTPTIIAAVSMKECDADVVGATEVGGTASELLKFCISVGGNPYQVTKLGSKATEIYPEVVNIQKMCSIQKYRWDYYVDDNVDGKANGWHPYSEAAWLEVEEFHDEWRTGLAAQPRAVKSGGWLGYTYLVDFTAMQQKNTSTRKVRSIRRVPL